MIGLPNDDPQAQFVRDHLLNIETERGQDSDIIARQRCTEALQHSEFGTKAHPILKYDPTYQLNVEAAQS
jgi:hypothetical protein